MSVEVIAAVLNHSPTAGNAKVILLGLANHAHPDGSNARPSVPRLARYARVDPRTVQRNLRELQADGHIERTGIGPHGESVYRVCMERLTQLGMDLPEGGNLPGAADRHPPAPVSPEGGDTSAAPGNLPPGDASVAQGVTPVSPEPSIEPSGTATPQPPQAGELALVGTPPPKKPTSKRQRDLDRFERDQAAWLIANLRPPTDADRDTFAAAIPKLRAALDAESFGNWLAPLMLAGRLRNDIALGAPAEIADWIRERFGDALEAAFGQRVRIVPVDPAHTRSAA